MSLQRRVRSVVVLREVSQCDGGSRGWGWGRGLLNGTDNGDHDWGELFVGISRGQCLRDGFMKTPRTLLITRVVRFWKCSSLHLRLACSLIFDGGREDAVCLCYRWLSLYEVAWQNRGMRDFVFDEAVVI
jgi:hypothetical protein